MIISLCLDPNYRAYSPLLEGANSIDLTEAGPTFMSDVNGFNVDKRSATLLSPHLYSVGKLLSYDTVKPSHLELYIPQSEQMAVTAGGQAVSGEHIAYYRPFGGQEHTTPTHADVLRHPGHTFTLTGSKFPVSSTDQPEHANLDGGMICFASQKGVNCQYPHQQVSEE